MIGRFRGHSLYKALEKYSEVIVYGIGNYANEIYPFLKAYHLNEKISYFTQTTESEMKFWDGIPIIVYRELQCNKSKCVILIAVSEQYSKEIRNSLIKDGFSNIVMLEEYVYDYKNIEERIIQLDSFCEYCKFIADWYVETHIDEKDKNVLFNKLMKRGRDKSVNRDLNLVVFICGHLSPRISKIVRALGNKGFRIIILSYWPERNLWCIDEMKKENILIYQCLCIADMLYQALQYNPLVYYFEPRWGDCLWAEIMLKNKNFFGKVIISLYDVLNDGFTTDQPLSKLESEKFVLENADGIVWRWFSKDALEKKGFNFQGKSIHFLDFCHQENTTYCSEFEESSVIRLCEVSGVGNEYVEERLYETVYSDYARVGEILDKIGNNDKCIFHFYAGRLSTENINICEEYKLKYSNFDYFLNTEHGELIERLKTYDYGCDFYTPGKFPPEDMVSGRYTGSVWKNSVRNIFFDYISAGVPIITTFPQRLLEYLERYNVVVKMDISNLDLDFLSHEKNFYKSNAMKIRSELDINNNIAQLIDFFMQVR